MMKMKTLREDQSDHPSADDMELMMECVEEELMPWQKEANEQAESEYAAVCKQIEDAKRKLIEKQMERRLEMERQLAEQAAAEPVAVPAAVLNHAIEPPDASKWDRPEVFVSV